MRAEMWKRKIGVQAFERVTKAGQLTDEEVGFLLDAVVEVGFTAPEVAPVLVPEGTKVFWPQVGKVTMTPRGLIEYHRAKGNKFYLLRMEELIRGCGSLLLPRLQEILMAYEGECAAEGVPPVLDNPIFVGGEGGDTVVFHGDGDSDGVTFSYPLRSVTLTASVDGPG